MSDASRSRVTLFFSSGTFLGRKHDGIIASVEHRIAEWSQVPEENGEGLQILKYEHGEKYDGKRERMRVALPRLFSALCSGRLCGAAVLLTRPVQISALRLFLSFWRYCRRRQPAGDGAHLPERRGGGRRDGLPERATRGHASRAWRRRGR